MTSGGRRRIDGFSATAGVLVMLLLAGCDREAAPQVTSIPADAPPTAALARITARGLEFDAPAEVPSGWTRWRFDNQSAMAHFALIERLPEGVDGADQQREVAPAFQRGLEALLAGETAAAEAAFAALPTWYGEVLFLGGPGLLSPGRQADAWVELRPGRYLLECYVKTDGRFHSYNPQPGRFGMVREFRVTAAASGREPPDTALNIRLSSVDGLRFEGRPAPGYNTFAVHFEDQKRYANAVGHDVHLARLEEAGDLDRLAGWMDWREAGGLATPAPVAFVGGLNEMPAGSLGYFAADLEPGRYALVAEVPDPGVKGLLLSFRVAP